MIQIVANEDISFVSHEKDNKCQFEEAVHFYFVFDSKTRLFNHVDEGKILFSAFVFSQQQSNKLLIVEKQRRLRNQKIVAFLWGEHPRLVFVRIELHSK